MGGLEVEWGGQQTSHHPPTGGTHKVHMSRLHHLNPHTPSNPFALPSVRPGAPETRVETEGPNIRTSLSLQLRERDYGRCLYVNQKEKKDLGESLSPTVHELLCTTGKDVFLFPSHFLFIVMPTFTNQPSVYKRSCEISDCFEFSGIFT